MAYLILFFSELLILYFLSKKIINRIYNLFFRVTKNRKIAGYLLALLFFPGTFIHEISHALAALFLFVPFGEIKLLPESGEKGIRMGSVAIEKTDPLRRFLIGIAPFVLGVSLILIVINYASMIRIIEVIWWGKLFVGYVVFEIGNMMFASKKDLEGVGKLFIFVLLLIILGEILGIQIKLPLMEIFHSNGFVATLRITSFYLTVPVIIDLGLILVLRMI